jgi:hypothetical protein
MTAIEPFSAPVETHKAAKMPLLLDLVNPSGYYRAYVPRWACAHLFYRFYPDAFSHWR